MHVRICAHTWFCVRVCTPFQSCFHALANCSATLQNPTISKITQQLLYTPGERCGRHCSRADKLRGAQVIVYEMKATSPVLVLPYTRCRWFTSLLFRGGAALFVVWSLCVGVCSGRLCTADSAFLPVFQAPLLLLRVGFYFYDMSTLRVFLERNILYKVNIVDFGPNACKT